MLTKEEKEYLDKIPVDKKVIIKPYDSKTPEVVEEFIKKIKMADANFKVKFIGASALGISGQGDIDLLILSQEKSFINEINKLQQVLGKPIEGLSTIVWRFEQQGHEIEICLVDPNDPGTARQLKIQKILSHNPALLQEYKRLKENASSQSYREYQRQKYEFYNRILNT